MDSKRFFLRCAGGIYWLIDSDQQGCPYKAPLRMNEMGADIWQQYCEGKDEEEIVSQLAADYGEDRQTIEKDVNVFLLRIKDFIS